MDDAAGLIDPEIAGGSFDDSGDASKASTEFRGEPMKVSPVEARQPALSSNPDVVASAAESGYCADVESVG